MTVNEVEIIGNNFTFKEVVYLIHDIEQFPRMVTGIILRLDSVVYILSCGTESSEHYAYEMSKEKTVY